MRRLGALFSAIFIGSFLLGFSTFFTSLMLEDGENLIAIALGVAGVATSAAAMIWIALLEGFFPGLDARKISQGLVVAGASLPLTGAAWIGAGGALGQAFFVGGLLAFAWCVSRLIGAFAGPPFPDGMPASLVHEPRGIGRAPRMRGTVEGFPATVEFSIEWNGNRSEMRSVALTQPEAARLEAHAATLMGGFTGSLEKTGDSLFDEAVHVRGARPLVLAILRAPARDTLLEVVRAGGSIANGVLVGDARVPLELLARAAAALTLPDSVLPTLRANAFADRDARVRLATLELLLSIEDRDARDEALAGCRAALDDGDPRLRILGMAVLRARGTPADHTRASRALDEVPRPGAVIAELLDRGTGGPHELALLELLRDERCGAEAGPAVERFAKRAEAGAAKDAGESLLDLMRRRVEEGRGQISLSALDERAGAVSIPDEAGRVSLSKKQPT